MYPQLEGQDALRRHLIHRLDALLTLSSLLVASPSEQTRIRGNCDEIELMLLEMLGMRMSDISLIEEKVQREQQYRQHKYGGYCLTGDGHGEHWWTKDGERLDSDRLDFRLPDNGIGDERAEEAEREFLRWVDESGIRDAKWLEEAGVHLVGTSVPADGEDAG